jgi:hypothetical protein
MHGRDDFLEIASQSRLAASEGDEHWVEEARGIGERLQLSGLCGRISLPVIAEAATCIAPHRDFEVHEHWALSQREISVLNEEDWDVPGFEFAG